MGKIRVERDAEKRLRVEAESDARRAKAAADQAAAAAAAASRSLKLGEKQSTNAGGSSGGEVSDRKDQLIGVFVSDETMPVLSSPRTASGTRREVVGQATFRCFFAWRTCQCNIGNGAMYRPLS